MCDIQSRVSGERRAYQLREVYGRQRAGAIGGQGLFGARIGRRYDFKIAQRVGRVDPVDEQNPGFSCRVGLFHDRIPQITGPQAAHHGSLPNQIPCFIGRDCSHEFVRRHDGHVEITQPRAVGFGVDKGFYVGMIAPHRRHHRAAPHPADNHFAGGVKDIHRCKWPCRAAIKTAHDGAGRPQRREIKANATAHLHR